MRFQVLLADSKSLAVDDVLVDDEKTQAGQFHLSCRSRLDAYVFRTYSNDTFGHAVVRLEKKRIRGSNQGKRAEIISAGCFTLWRESPKGSFETEKTGV